MSVITDQLAARSLLSKFTPEMVRELAISQRVCVRPIMRRVLDRATGSDTTVAIACGSTRELICPPCAFKARTLRMLQCTEGWHRTDEPARDHTHERNCDHDCDHHCDDECDRTDACGQAFGDDQDADDSEDDGNNENDGNDEDEQTGRRVRSTRRREDVSDLPRMPQEDRTVGQVFTGSDGHEYRPSMFLTLTLPSYGLIRPGGHGVPASPSSYDYRRAALDALHFPKLLDRFWQNLRRAAGYYVQYFAAVEPQARLAPHLHAAIRGVIPREVMRQVIRGTYVQVWWPPHDEPVYDEDQGAALPVWTGAGYADPTTGVLLPTWEESLSANAADPDARPVHVMRFGTQYDMRGIVAPSPEADRAVRYLTKYLTKAIADPLTAETGHQAPARSDDQADDQLPFDLGREVHINRLHAELRYLPCSPRCANWLRYAVQPKDASPGLRPGWCASKAHDREHLGLGGRRVMVSRQWSGKTLAGHKADRATVVRETLLAAGIVAPETERMAADTLHDDGLPRFVWTDTRPDPRTYTRVILESIAERHRWRQQYQLAKTITTLRSHSGAADLAEPGGSVGAVEIHSATEQPP